ncbi:MAG: peptidyl-alpha-hydroxyglycine alpha-amidating lyase family protein [Ferruginibacter sp.]
MSFKKLIYAILILVLLLAVSYIFQDKKIGNGSNANTKYELAKDWLKLPDSILLGEPTGIGIDTSQNIFIFHRAKREWPLIGSMPKSLIKERTILIVDSKSGQFISSWGENLFVMPHGLTVDNHNNVWVTDVGLHQVFKFTDDGKLLMTLGEARMPGKDKTHFNRPTDIAIANDGSFYVSDGYGNSRVIKFSPGGKYLFEWGKKGKKDGEFNVPHGLSLDSKGNVYIADRENSRVQVFDSTGKFLKQYSNKNLGNICAVTIGTNDRLYAADDVSFLKIKHRGSDVFSFDTAGIVQTRFGRSGFYNGPVCWYHDMVLDSQQNIYVGDILNNSVQKFKNVSTQ